MTWGNLGSACRFISGRESQAREALERAIALMRERLERNPADAIGWARLAGWLSNRGRHEDAIQAARHALDLAPSDVECMASAGGVYLQAGDRPLALRWVREAVRHGYGAGALRRSPSFAPLRDDPEFLRILEDATARAAR
jgi:tetratricopeptide (TPR) repeat protein